MPGLQAETPPLEALKDIISTAASHSPEVSLMHVVVASCGYELGLKKLVPLYQHDPRHVDVLVESLGLENGNTVQTPIIDRKYRSHVARCLFFSQDRADITFAVNELCQRMSDLSMDPSFRIRGQESEVTVFSAGVALMGRHFWNAYTRKLKSIRSERRREHDA